MNRDETSRTGMMALEEGSRVDFTRLRHDRRRRLARGMEAAGLDALVLGRGPNVRYAAGARQLWRAGTSPFAPMCVMVAETGKVHLLSVWDEGVPPEIGHDELYGLFWNPANLLEALRGIPGLAEAERVGTDGFTPLFGRLQPAIAPKAEVVDASPLLSEARATKTADEVACITVAATLAEAALCALEHALAPGVTERQLLGVFYECVCRLGSPAPASESVAFATPAHGPVRFRHLVSDRPVGEGELVALAPSALYAGYEGGLARTRVAGSSAPKGTAALAGRCRTALDALVAACRPGAAGADLYAAWESTGEPAPTVLLANGIGIGTEPPVIGFGRGRTATLVEGQVLSVQAWAAHEGTGGFLEREVVLVGAEGPQVLTRGERFPL